MLPTGIVEQREPLFRKPKPSTKLPKKPRKKKLGANIKKKSLSLPKPRAKPKFNPRGQPKPRARKPTIPRGRPKPRAKIPTPFNKRAKPKKKSLPNPRKTVIGRKPTKPRAKIPRARKIVIGRKPRAKPRVIKPKPIPRGLPKPRPPVIVT